jgi:hypothetical protein
MSNPKVAEGKIIKIKAKINDRPKKDTKNE